MTNQPSKSFAVIVDSRASPLQMPDTQDEYSKISTTPLSHVARNQHAYSIHRIYSSSEKYQNAEIHTHFTKFYTRLASQVNLATTHGDDDGLCITEAVAHNLKHILSLLSDRDIVPPTLAPISEGTWALEWRQGDTTSFVKISDSSLQRLDINTKQKLKSKGKKHEITDGISALFSE